MVILGTRPEAIKLAPVIHAFRAMPDRVELTVCSTGQHRDMLDTTLKAYAIQADIDLGVMTGGQHVTDLLGRLLLELRPVLEKHRPDVIVVQGDTTTVMAAALAGYAAQSCVAHVEAGLRTGDKHAPFPEEINRRVTSVVADHHFAPTPQAVRNLQAEGISEGRVHLTGNTVVDALYWMRDHVAGRPLPEELAPRAPRMILVTAHRRESFGEPFRRICHALRDVADRFSEVELIYPVHLNPNVREPVHTLLGDHPRIRLVAPQPPDRFVALMDRAHFIITDSGGIQEEAPALGKPVLVLRDVTERPEAVAAGVVHLVGTDHERIVSEAATLLTDPQAYAAMARPVAVYGDGKATRRIVEVLTTGSMQTPPFQPQAS